MNFKCCVVHIFVEIKYSITTTLLTVVKLVQNRSKDF